MATGINGQETGFAHRHLPLPTDNEKQPMHLDQYPWQQRCASATRHTAKAMFPHHHPYQCPSHRLTNKTRTQAALPASSQRRHDSYTLFRTRPTIDTHAATEVAKLYNAAYTYQQLDAKTAAATLSQLKELWQKAQSDTYNEYTNQAPLIGWALANVYLINHDELNALHTLDRLIELTAPQSLVQTKAIELRHKIKNRKKIFGLL